MILRSLKLTNFRGVESLAARDLPREGVARIDLPADTDPSVLADALRFVVTGAEPDGGIFSEGAGFAFVEVGLHLGDDERASLFRGRDSRGNAQVSLREDGGRRVTGGDDAVHARLTVLLGGEPAEQLAGAWPTAADLDPATLAARAPHASDSQASDRRVEIVPLPDFTEETGVAVAGPLLDLRLDALAAVRDLRSALRAESLGRLATERHDELLAMGGRLRRERLSAAQTADELAAERDRVRARLSRVQEYRAGVDADARASAEPAATGHAESNVSYSAPWALATIASGLFLVLVMISTGRGEPLASDSVQTAVGIAFLIAVGLSVSVTARRLSEEDRAEQSAAAPTEREHGSADVGRASLQQRFKDLGDPDDPELVATLEARAVELDGRLTPLHGKLESIDDALAAFDVEAGRAARALHLPMPERVTGTAGLAEDESVEAVRVQVRDLGDATYQAIVERDALLAGGASPVAAAAETAAAALAELASMAEEPESATHAALERWRAPGVEIAPDLGEAELASVEQAIERLAVSAAARAAGIPAPYGSAGGTAAEASDEDFEPSSAVAEATGGEFDAVQRCADGSLRARATHARGGTDWDQLEPQMRTRIAVALALSATPAAAGAAAGVVVLPIAPVDVEDDALLGAARAAHASVAQVVVPAFGADASGPAAAVEPTAVGDADTDGDADGEPAAAAAAEQEPPQAERAASEGAQNAAAATASEADAAKTAAKKSTGRTKKKRKSAAKSRRRKKS